MLKQVKGAIQKKFILWLMVVAVMTGTVTTGYVETVQAETTVYVTPTGAKYHTHKCGRGSYYASTLSAAKARGLTACAKCFPNGDRSSSKTTTHKTVKKMKLNQSSLEMVVGQTKSLKASNTTGTVKWSSGNAAVVSVSSSGKLTAKGKGKTTITVTSGSQKKQCKVTVESPELTESNLTMEYKDTETLKLSGCKHSVKWSTSDSAVVTVSKGKITAKGAGQATVKAKAHGRTYSCKVKVKKPVVTSVTTGEYESEMETYDSQEVEIKIKPSAAVGYYDVKAVSSDPSVVSADVIEYGDEIYVELNSEDQSGTVTITVSAGGKTTSFTVTVVGDEIDQDDETNPDEGTNQDDETNPDDETDEDDESL
jgi:hypothetical protein